MYQNYVFEHKSHLFRNGEIFICTASIFENSKTIDWGIPKCAAAEFKDEIQKIVIDDPVTSTTTGKIKDIICRVFDIEEYHVKIDISVQYEIEDKNGVDIQEIVYNQKDKIEILKSTDYDEYYLDKDQKTTAKIVEGEIVSIAFDNKNGAITVQTQEKFRNKGYSTQCVQKLVYMYPDNEKDRLGWGTTLENIASQRVAEKAGMKKISLGYWARISKNIGKDYYSKHQKYFK